MRRLVPIATVASLAIALAAVLPAPPAAAFLFGRKKPAYDWTDLGTEFCARTLAGDLAGIRPLISSQLAADIEFAAATGPLPPTRILFQTYENAVPVCRVRTMSAALVEVERSNPNGAPPATAPAATTTSCSPPAAATRCARACVSGPPGAERPARRARDAPGRTRRVPFAGLTPLSGRSARRRSSSG